MRAFHDPIERELLSQAPSCPRHGPNAARVVMTTANEVRFVSCGIEGCGLLLFRREPDVHPDDRPH